MGPPRRDGQEGRHEGSRSLIKGVLGGIVAELAKACVDAIIYQG